MSSVFKRPIWYTIDHFPSARGLVSSRSKTSLRGNSLTARIFEERDFTSGDFWKPRRHLHHHVWFLPLSPIFDIEVLYCDIFGSSILHYSLCPNHSDSREIYHHAISRMSGARLDCRLKSGFGPVVSLWLLYSDMVSCLVIALKGTGH